MSESVPPPTIPLKEKAIVGLLKFSGLMPLWLSRGIGSFVGWCLGVFPNRSHHTTRANLRVCFPDMDPAERDALARQSLIHTGQAMLETGAVWLRDLSWLTPHILKVHNKHIIEDALAEGRGVILLGPHLGNWEVFGLHLNEYAKITSLYKPPELSSLEDIIRGAREKAGAEVVPTNRRGVVALLKVMKAGGMTGILPDQIPDDNGGDFAPFYGVPAYTMSLVNSLRSRSGAVVLAGYAKRVKGGFEIVFVEADPLIYSDDEIEALTGLNKTVERCVDGAPEQYQWEYKRFRKQPQGAHDLYKR